MTTLKQALVALILSVTFSQAQALNKAPFSSETFEDLQVQGAVILVDVWASWCSTCAAQQELLKTYAKKHPENNLHILVIDYDKQKDLVEEYRAPRQSTLILFKGDKQLWYSVAEKNYGVIERELNQAFKL